MLANGVDKVMKSASWDGEMAMRMPSNGSTDTGAGRSPTWHRHRAASADGV